MMYPLRTERPLPPRSTSRIQLMLRTPDGAPWSVSLSPGMERFIGHYSRVPGLSSGSSLLQYKPTGRERNG
jgi:hypothetical protein